MALWPQVQGQVYQWKYVPFEIHGKPATVVTRGGYLRRPSPAPACDPRNPAPHQDLIRRSRSRLERTHSLYGPDPAYSGDLINNTGIVYESRAFTVSDGKHTEKTDPDAVRKLAKQFVDADFYSMSPRYAAYPQAPIGTRPTRSLSTSMGCR